MLIEHPTHKEVILVGDLINDQGISVTHATTIVRLVRQDKEKKRDVPVLVYLDFNLPHPQSSHPKLITE
jgi:hypothetical protein